MSKKIVLKSAAPRSSSKKVKNAPNLVPRLSDEEIQAKIDEYNKGIIIPSDLLGTPRGRNALLKKEVVFPFNWARKIPDHLKGVYGSQETGWSCSSFNTYELNMRLGEKHREGILPKGYICKLLRAGVIENMFCLLGQIFNTESLTAEDIVIFDQIAKLVSPKIKVPRPAIPITTHDILVRFFRAHHDQVPASSIEKVVDFFKDHEETITMPIFAEVCAAGRLTEHKLKQMLRLDLDLNKKVGTQMMHSVIYSYANLMENRSVTGFLSHGSDISEAIKILQLIKDTTDKPDLETTPKQTKVYIACFKSVECPEISDLVHPFSTKKKAEDYIRKEHGRWCDECIIVEDQNDIEVEGFYVKCLVVDQPGK